MALAVLTNSAFAANTRLTINCFWPPQHLVCTKILPEWVDKVKAATDGRVRAMILPTSAAPPPEQLAAVEKGIADVAIQFNGLIANRVTGPMVGMIPFIATEDAAQMSVALWETNRKFFPDEFKSVHLLSQFVISPAQLFSQTDVPVNSMADLHSRKIWVLPGPLAEIAKKEGAGVVSTPAVKSNEIISRGIVDAFLGLNGDDVQGFQLAPYAKSMTRFSTGIYTTTFSMFINKDKWSKISKDDQAKIEAVSGAEIGKRVGAEWDKASTHAIEELGKGGMKVVDADPAFEAQFRESSKFVSASWLEKAKAAGIDGQAALDFYTSRIKALSGK